MAVVAPSTHVMLLQNVPLDKTYRDTMTFANKTAQYMYFSSKVAYTADACQFVRTEGAIRFPEDAEKIDTCNYLMFQNEGFGNKWYYAFIDRVEYAQTGMSRIWFTLDVMQTWAFDYTVHPCMVVREHVTDDSVGANLVAEDLPTGPYINTGYTEIGSVQDKAIIVGVTEEIDDTPVGGPYCGVYQAVNYYAVRSLLGDDAVENFIKDYTSAGKATAIVSMYLIPDSFTSSEITSVLRKLPTSLQPQIYTRNLPPAPVTIDGYTPRNNKVLTYPYSYLYVTSKSGSANVYRYEMFDGAPKFSDVMYFLQPVERKLIPDNYGNPLSSQVANLNDDDAVVSAGGPVCAWSFDSYQQYINANRFSVTLGLAKDVVLEPFGSAIGSAASGNVVGAITPIFDAIGAGLNQVAKSADMKKIPPTLSGSLSTQGLNFSLHALGMFYAQKTITADYAKMIDDYFTAYGYQVNRLKVPNIKTRPSWNYVQTSKAMITGSIPFGDLDIIRDNFNRGITFWHGDWVGDYTRNNGEQGYTPPVGPVDPPIEPPTETVTWGFPFADWQSHVTSEYGWRTNPITGEGQQFHSGIDIAYPTGTQIMAIASGAVIRETSSSGRGMYMDVKVNDEYTYRYQHLSAYDVPNNSAVTLGEYIAKVGATGDVTGSHLHLEILKNGQTVDPRPYLEGAYNG